MEDKKITFTKERELSKKADELTEKFIKNGYAQNPIDAKFLAFKEVKKEIKVKDIL